MSGSRDKADNDDFDRRMAGFAIATADQGYPLIDKSVNDVLRLVREVLSMDVTFASRFEMGPRILQNPQHVEGDQVITPASSDALELGLCRRVVDGPLPELVNDIPKLPY